MVLKLAENSKASGKNNISFVCYMLLGKLEKCLDLLIETDRIPEAAFFARYVLDRLSYFLFTDIIENSKLCYNTFKDVFTESDVESC